MSRFCLTIVIEVHDPRAVIEAAQEYVASCDGIDDGINSVAEALPYVIEAGLVPLDHGFEIVDSSLNCNEARADPLPVWKEP